VNQSRGTQRYQPTRREDEDALTPAIVTLASQYGRYGYRRIPALLRRDGWEVGKDRVERIWRREGLKVPQRQKLCLPPLKRQPQCNEKPLPIQCAVVDRKRHIHQVFHPTIGVISG
jgi:transposase InsO family protein